MSDIKGRAHPSFKEPTNKDIRIWRYMDLAKYIAMLQSRALFFPKASLLGDPFEGSSTKPMIAARQQLAQHITSQASTPLKDPVEFARIFSDTNKNMVDTYLVNCWHMNEQESAAMWSQYSRSNEAVCIQSTYRRLDSCLPLIIFIGEVKYIDYNVNWFEAGMGFNYIIHKRKSFEHERELRAVFWTKYGVPEAQEYKKDIDSTGIHIKIDLNSLIERVYISPLAASWFAAVVRTANSDYNCKFPVVQSSLSEPAVF
jgi:hypothetical protein